MMKNTGLLILLFFFVSLPINSSPKWLNGKPEVIIKKNNTFNGKALQALYTAVCPDKTGKTMRTFEIVKSDAKLFDYFMSEFVLSEIGSNQKRMYYPFAWADSRISLKDIETDCKRIISEGIKPVDF